MAAPSRRASEPYKRSRAQWAKFEAREFFNRAIEEGLSKCPTPADSEIFLCQAEQTALRKFNILTDPRSLKEWPNFSIDGDLEPRSARSLASNLLRSAETDAREKNFGLLQRWLLRRKRYLRDQFDRAAPATDSKPAPSATEAQPASTDPGYKTLLGRNIDTLRLDCGWSYDEMYAVTGISKKRSIGHVKHGKDASPKNLKLYADAFATKLGRTITVQHLKG